MTKCGGKHSSGQCIRVQGACNNCGQFGHFSRVCPLSGTQDTASPPQGRSGGSSRGMSAAAEIGGSQPRGSFLQPGPSLFVGSYQLHFSGPQRTSECHDKRTSGIGGVISADKRPIRSMKEISIPLLVFTRKPAKFMRTESPRRDGRNEFRWRRRRHDGGRRRARERGGDLRGESFQHNLVHLDDSLNAPIYRIFVGLNQVNGPRDIARRGLTNHCDSETHFGLNHRIMVKRLVKSPHDPLGIIDSACKKQLVMVSVHGPFSSNITISSTTIGKSRIARDSIAMHTFWRSNSDIACAISIGYPCTRASGESSTTKHRILHASGSHPIPPPDDPS
ncbi:hypothetical protein F511_29627 [Dorcoceras hygrometricum]|uniref:CCHC-type domain-containing protein n=1 Tax=Dorcoceras hygrometricum TaxID=472368 RepID=A0A2Z7CD00_9LAMI|nr:hypothetical protein F511_29627 [Dorcoceras hygrometricum]